jgi:hypothetical protein
MESWHKIGIFLVGFVGLIWQLYSSARQAAEEAKEEDRPEKKWRIPPEHRTVYQVGFLALVILAMFIVPKLLADIITFLAPHPEKISGEIIAAFYQLLFYLGKKEFGDEAYFLQGRGLMALEWFLVLSPYIIGFAIWSMKIIIRGFKA